MLLARKMISPIENLKYLKDLCKDGAPTRLSRQKYDKATGLVTVKQAANGLITELEYDDYGNVTNEIERSNQGNKENRHTKHYYNLAGKHTATLNPEGYLTIFELDYHGKRISKISYNNKSTCRKPWDKTTSLEQLIESAGNDTRVEFYIYNEQGRKVGIVDALGYLTETIYTRTGKVAEKIRYKNKVTRTEQGYADINNIRPKSSAEDQSDTYQYDAANRLVRHQNSNGLVTRYFHDNSGNIIKQLEYDHAIEPPRVEHKEIERALVKHKEHVRGFRKKYDPFGHVIAEVTGQGHSELIGLTNDDEIEDIWNKYATKYVYDINTGLKAKTIDACGNVTRYFYDDNYQLRFTVNPNAEVTEYDYNIFGEKVLQKKICLKTGT